MARTLSHLKITPRRSSARGHAEHGWLDSYHTFSFAQYFDRRFQSFGALRVLNEDRVAPGTGFPTHQHRDAEIFSYILDGELTHRDSMHGRPSKTNTHDDTNKNTDTFSRLHRGDVQFTTGGSGIAHSEQNEHASSTVHFLQIWALPWKKSLPPIYHTQNFPQDLKRQRFVTLISPLRAGPEATPADEKAAIPAIEGTIPIHADFLMGAAIIPHGASFTWKIGCGGVGKTESKAENETENETEIKKNYPPATTAVQSLTNRKQYIHLPMMHRGAKIHIHPPSHSDSVAESHSEPKASVVVLEEGDGAFVEGGNAGDELVLESVGAGEAEVVVLDSK